MSGELTGSAVSHLECSKTGQRFDAGVVHNTSPGGWPLLVRYDLDALKARWDRDSLQDGPDSMWRYAQILPVRRAEHIVSLREGWTPLHRLGALADRLECSDLWLKDEGTNPTGSFKARGMSCAISMCLELGVRRVEVGQYLTAGTQIVSLTDLSVLYANFTVTEKDSAQLKVGQIVRLAVDAYPGRTFDGKITTIEPQIATDTRNIRVQATLQNPDKILKPGMFATTTVVLPDKPPVITVPETAVDYTLYGDSVYLLGEKQGEDGKTSLTVTRTFVQTGNRVEGRAEIIKGLKDGDRVVAVGQLKLQSGSAVEISNNPLPPIPAKPPRY